MATAPHEFDVERLAQVAHGYPEAEIVVLFGSVARGAALSSSDADIGVLGCSYWRALELGAELGRELGREPHVVELETASDWLRIQIAREGILLAEREPDAWVRFRAQAIVGWLDIAPMVERCAAGVRRRLSAEARRG